MKITGKKPYSVVCAKTGKVLRHPDNGLELNYAYRKYAILMISALSVRGIPARLKVDTEDTDIQKAWRDREIKEQSKAKPTFVGDRFFLLSPYNNLHFPRHSKKFPGKVAYTPSEADGIENRQTVTTMRRYLERFFCNVLTMEEKEKIAAQFGAEAGVDTLIKFAVTPEEIERVYVRGPSSCMSHRGEYFGLKIHPARFYAAGDIAVAYMVNKHGKICARAITIPSKKVHGRIYGAFEKMSEAFNILGYRFADRHDFNGVRVNIYDAKEFEYEIDVSDESATANFIVKPIFDQNNEILEKFLKRKVCLADARRGINIEFVMPYLDEPFSFDDIGEIYRTHSINGLDYNETENCLVGRIFS